MTDLKMFNPADQVKADKALAAYDHYMVLALDLVATGNFDSAATCHRNIANALDDLSRLKNQKQMVDQARELLRQIDQREAIRRNMF